MTKSDMIIYLATQINEKWDIPWASYGGEPRANQLEFFEDVLNLCEKKGMLPPKQLEGFFIPEVKSNDVNEWEDEDETL